MSMANQRDRKPSLQTADWAAILLVVLLVAFFFWALLR
jgi:hypothetical protein